MKSSQSFDTEAFVLQGCRKFLADRLNELLKIRKKIKVIASSMLEEKRRKSCPTCKVKKFLIGQFAKAVEYLLLEIGQDFQAIPPKRLSLL